MEHQKPQRIENKALVDKIRGERCVCCGIRPAGGVDAHHVTTKGAGGGDTINNLMPLCRIHHAAVHQYGYNKACKKYPGVQRWLIQHERDDILENIDED